MGWCIGRVEQLTTASSSLSFGPRDQDAAPLTHCERTLLGKLRGEERRAAARFSSPIQGDGSIEIVYFSLRSGTC